MRTLVLATVLGLAAISGCAKKSDDAAHKEPTKVPEITVDQLDTMLAKSECIPVDANGVRTREKMGVIPGAVLLTDSEMFAAAELPADKSKTLVFYCANTNCGASHEAATRALMAGHTNVKVLPDGIAGWVKAGKKIQSI